MKRSTLFLRIAAVLLITVFLMEYFFDLESPSTLLWVASTLISLAMATSAIIGMIYLLMWYREHRYASTLKHPPA